MNYRGAILWGVFLILFLLSCSKDPADYRAYDAAHPHSVTDTTKTGGTHGTGGSTGTGTGTGGSTGTSDTTGTSDPGDRPDDPDHPDEPRDYYFKGTLNGKNLAWNVTDNFTGWAIGSGSTVANDMGDLQGGLSALLSASEGFKPQLGVEFYEINVRFDADKTAYLKGFITTGVWPLATKDADLQPGKKGIVIRYIDAGGTEYSSLGAQTGGDAKVSSVTYIPTQLGVNDAFKIKLTFNCTLYPVSGTGASLSLANGQAVIRLENSL